MHIVHMNLRNFEIPAGVIAKMQKICIFRWENAYFLRIWGQTNACTCKKGAEVPSLPLHTQKICILSRENAYFLHIGYHSRKNLEVFLGLHCTHRKYAFCLRKMHIFFILATMHISCILAITLEGNSEFL